MIQWWQFDLWLLLDVQAGFIKDRGRLGWGLITRKTKPWSETLKFLPYPPSPLGKERGTGNWINNPSCLCGEASMKIPELWGPEGASQVALVVKILPAKAGDIRDRGMTPGSGRFPGGGHSNPFQYSCLENPMDRGAWLPTVHRVAKNCTWLKRLGMHAYSVLRASRFVNTPMHWEGVAHPDSYVWNPSRHHAIYLFICMLIHILYCNESANVNSFLELCELL